jgi:trehalose 6-phosphate synthase
VEQLVGQINGDFSTMSSVAIKYLHQDHCLERLVALYRSADVMLVTPFRDGMNLVAKEFVAANHNRAASLVLSEFAGAANQLRAARLVNPFDIVDVKQAILDSLSMATPHRLRTMHRLAHSVRRHDAAWWSKSFIDRLETVA